MITVPKTDTLWELVEYRADRHGDDPMLTDPAGTTLTVAQFRDAVSRTAAGLYERGVHPGSTVAWQLPTTIATMVLMTALRRLGAVQVPLVPIYREREVEGALAHLTVDTVVLSSDGPGLGPAAAGALPGSPRVLVLDDEPLDGDPTTLPPPDGDGAAVRWVHFTSGSSGVPKGVRHSDTSLLRAGVEWSRRAGLGAGDVGLIAFPLAHIGGVCALLSMLLSGMSSVLTGAFTPPTAVELIRRHGVTFMGGSPVFIAMLLEAARSGAQLPSLRLFKGGGGPCPPHLYEAARDELGVVVAHDYSMTEAPTIAVASPTDTAEQLASTDGRPVPGCELRIAADGEIQVRGEVLCHGYTDPELIAAAFTDDGWYRTGDLGHLRADGHLVVTGRTKDLIIRKGEKIAPLEIEELLAARPDVADVAVLGLPDPIAGERVCAVVVAQPGTQPPTLTALAGQLTTAGLMRQKLPERLEIVEALPRTTNGKIDKQVLRQRFS